jgi:hypothetical protein
MEVNIFGFRLNLSRAICMFCMGIDFTALALLFLTFQNPLVIPSSAVALGFSFVGIYDEIRYQAAVLNFFSHGKQLDLLAVELFLVTIISFLFVFSSVKALTGFAIGSITLLLINKYRYHFLENDEIAKSLKCEYLLMLFFIIEVIAFV